MRDTDRSGLLVAGALAIMAANPDDGRLRIGPMAICRERMISATIGRDEYTDQPSLIVVLDAVGRTSLARVTAEHVGETLPIRIGRQIIARPLIAERINDGELAITGPAVEKLDGARRATMIGCPAPRTLARLRSSGQRGR